MKVIQRKHYGLLKNFTIYDKGEADEIGIDYIYWRDAKKGDKWIIGDDEYVVELLRINKGNVFVTSVGTIMQDADSFYGNKIMMSPEILQDRLERFTGKTHLDRKIALKFLKYITQGMTLLEAIMRADADYGVRFTHRSVNMPYVRLSAMLKDDMIQKQVSHYLRKRCIKTYKDTIKTMEKSIEEDYILTRTSRNYVLRELRKIVEQTDDEKVKLGALKELARMTVVVESDNQLNIDDENFELPELDDEDEVDEQLL